MGPKTIPAEWLAKVERPFAPLAPDALAAMPPLPTLDPVPLPTLIYNGMINPLTSFGIKGALWYQGEANAGNGWAYRTYLPLLIQGWREHWGIGDFPFYIVQLSTYLDPPKTPDGGDVHWPQLREAQLMTWQKVPNTGMVVTVDIGSGGDVHPKDKKDVGHRLALWALANTYGRKMEVSGPIYDSMTVEGNKIRLKFTHLGGGLVVKDAQDLCHLRRGQKVGVGRCRDRWRHRRGLKQGRARAGGRALRVVGQSSRLQSLQSSGTARLALPH
jgi:hypothetical protein